MSHPAIVEGKPSAAYRYGVTGQLRTREWTVVATSPDNALDQLAAIGFTRGVVFADPYGALYDAQLRLQEFEVATIIPAPTAGGSGYYAVTATYTYSNVRLSLVPDESGAPVYRMESAVVSEPSEVDAYGLPYLNAAGEPFENQSREVLQQVLRVEWVSDLYPSWLAAYSIYAQFYNKINAGPAYTAEAKCLRLIDIDIDEQDRAASVRPGRVGNPYLRYTCRFAYRPPFTLGSTTYGGWERPRLNQGYRRRSPEYGPNTTAKIKDGENADVTRPVNLSADGTLGGIGVAPNWILFRDYFETPFPAALFPGA